MAKSHAMRSRAQCKANRRDSIEENRSLLRSLVYDVPCALALTFRRSLRAPTRKALSFRSILLCVLHVWLSFLYNSMAKPCSCVLCTGFYHRDWLSVASAGSNVLAMYDAVTPSPKTRSRRFCFRGLCSVFSGFCHAHVIIGQIAIGQPAKRVLPLDIIG